MLHKFVRPLYARDKNEAHRAATPLELFFDLVIVIAFASAAYGLEHAIAEHHVEEGLISFFMAFMAIWWLWNLFTWFGSAFDNDDTLYRGCVMLAMFGAILVAANVPQFFSGEQLTYAFIGYVITRVAHVINWIRAGIHNKHLRATSIRYAVGQALLQCYWAYVVFGVEPGSENFFIAYFIGFAGELFVPWAAEKKEGTTWHRHHIIERFGLLNIIVLGEVLLSSTISLREAFQSTGEVEIEMIKIATCGIIMSFAMWWLYFSEEDHLDSNEVKRAFMWAYGHILIFAAGVATGAGIAVVIEYVKSLHHISHHHISFEVAAYSLTIPVFTYVLGLWIVRDRFRLNAKASSIMMIQNLGILFSPLLFDTILAPTILLVSIVITRQIFCANKVVYCTKKFQHYGKKID